MKPYPSTTTDRHRPHLRSLHRVVCVLSGLPLARSASADSHRHSDRSPLQRSVPVTAWRLSAPPDPVWSGFPVAVRRRRQQLDFLMEIRKETRKELLAESRKHPARKLLEQIPRLGPIRVALLIALIQTPHRFLTKRQLWNYCGPGLRTRSSGEYRSRGPHVR